ncbi:unnamed protein product [Paramecium sonneborni]|uniref:Cyclic nucleotide-binding domain-containing protein n=1 Tax=Paramecium sonneborni TaxID=65129 RepID=A0A8S1R7I6_9CILI|nr:unnamed protein product [Paramecium sonneborni]
MNSELYSDRELLQGIKKSESMRSQRQLKSCPAYLKTLQFQKYQNIQRSEKTQQFSKANPLNVFIRIIRFITLITQSIFPQDFKYLDSNMFKIIGDKTADFSFYVKNDYFKYIKAAPESRIQQFLQMTILRYYTIQQLIEYLSHAKFLFKPEQTQMLIWNIYLLIMINFNFLYCSIKFAFNFDEREPEYYKEGEVFLLIIPFISYLIDILVKLNSGYYEAGYLVTDRKKIIKHFYNSNECIIDSLIIMISLGYFFDGNNNNILSLFMIIKMLDVPQRVGLILDKLELTTNYWAIYDLIRLIYFIIIEAHTFCCFLYFVGKQNKSVSWIIKEDLIEADLTTSYLTTFYWSVITMTTIGYGDFTPQNLSERVLIIFVAIVSCCTFGFFVSSIGQIIYSIQKKEQQIRLDLNDLKKYLRVRGFNQELQIKIRRYFEYLWNDCMGQEQLDMFKLQQQLPSNLYNEMILDLNLKSISKIPFFHDNFSSDFLQALAGDFEEEKLTPWQSIFTKGEQSQYLYILCEGEVEYYVSLPEGSGNCISIQKMDGQDEIFGQQDFLLDQNYSINCRTTKPSRILKIHRDKFQQIAKKYGYEKYCQLKDLVKFSGRFDEFHIQCIGCNKSTHLLYNCPMLTGFPSRTKTLLKYKKKYCQERQVIRRTNLERRISTLSLESKISDSVLYYLLKDPKMSEQLNHQIKRNMQSSQNGSLRKSQKKITNLPKRGVPIFLSQEQYSRTLDTNFQENLGFQYNKGNNNKQEKIITQFDQEISFDESSKIIAAINKQFLTKGTINSNNNLKSSVVIQEIEKDWDSKDEKTLLIESKRGYHQESMGRYKDIFECFEYQRDYESYMPHMNFKLIQEFFQKSREIDSFHNFIDVNIVKRKWKRSKIVVVLES